MYLMCELADIHGPVFGSDVGDDHMQAAAIRKHCVDKGAREVETFDLPNVGKRDRRELSPPQRSLDERLMRGATAVYQTIPPSEPARHRWAELLTLVGSVRRLAFDRTLPTPEALGRIRDTFHDYDRRGVL
jgi:hypothetical protein